MIALKDKMREAGIVGAGGAGFPSYAKLTNGIDALVVNGAECEPLLYTDYVIMRDNLEKLCMGMAKVRDALGAKNAYLSIKDHTAKKLSFSDEQTLFCGVKVKILPDAYPMGDEIAVIYQTLGRIVPPGKLPASVGVIVYNVETILNLYEALYENGKVIEKWLTIGGDIEKPYVVKVPLGMRVSELFALLNIKVDEEHSVIDGGPSMGNIINYNTAIIRKTTKALLILPNTCEAVASKRVSMDTQLKRASSACCQCTRCTDMCPRALLGYPLEPHRLVRVATSSETIDPKVYVNASLCCSCGICSTAACSQGISPKDVILKLKSELAKNKLRFDEDMTPTSSAQRDYRLVPSTRWEVLLGIKAFDREGEFYKGKIEATKIEIPMRNHIGAPSKPVCKVGDMVSRGDKVAEASDGLSLPQYSSIDGKIIFVDENRILIEK